MRFDLDLLSEDTKPYFRDVYDHAMRINEAADTLREVLATALDANLSVISVSQNTDTKRLAAWTAIIAASTAISSRAAQKLLRTAIESATHFTNVPFTHCGASQESSGDPPSRPCAHRLSVNKPCPQARRPRYAQASAPQS